MTKEEVLVKKYGAAVGRVVSTHDADILLYSGWVDSPADEELIELVSKRKHRPHLLLFLNTNGGDADAGYRMMRSLQRHYTKIIVLIRHSCMSAGTLMALGADEIVMTECAELGPLDVQVRKQDEIGERTSGLTPLQALNTLKDEAFTLFENHFLKLRTRSMFQMTTRTCASIAARHAIGLMAPIYAQIDPMRLGEMQRALMIAHDYGERLARKNLKEGALVRLVSGYQSHGFVIDRNEAKALFRNVRHPSKDENALGEMLEPLIDLGMRQDDALVKYLAGKPPTIKKPRGKKSHEQQPKTRTDAQEGGRDRQPPPRHGASKSVRPGPVAVRPHPTTASNGSGGGRGRPRALPGPRK